MDDDLKKEEGGISAWANLASEAIRSGNKEELGLVINELQRQRCRFMKSGSRYRQKEKSPEYNEGLIVGIIHTLLAVDNHTLNLKEENVLNIKHVARILEYVRDYGYSEIDMDGNGPEKLRGQLGMERQEFQRLCKIMCFVDFLVRPSYGAGYSWCIGPRGLVALTVIESRRKNGL